MRISHVAIWVRNIERTRNFFETYFDASASARYDNHNKGFSSYFLSFHGEDTCIEIMSSTHISQASQCPLEPALGMGHIAFSLGSKKWVDDLTQRLVEVGYNLLSGPRTTGDGYYESCFCIDNDFILELTV